MTAAKNYFLILALTLLLSACGGAAQVDGAGISISVAPEISLLGEQSISINVGTTYNDPGATANDAEDGDISNAIRIDSTLDVSTPGEYEIIYSVTDSDGNTTSVTRLSLIHI